MNEHQILESYNYDSIHFIMPCRNKHCFFIFLPQLGHVTVLELAVKLLYAMSMRYNKLITLVLSLATKTPWYILHQIKNKPILTKILVQLSSFLYSIRTLKLHWLGWKDCEHSMLILTKVKSAVCQKLFGNEEKCQKKESTILIPCINLLYLMIKFLTKWKLN